MKEKLYDTDAVMRTTWLCLLDDFRHAVRLHHIYPLHDIVRTGKIKEFRDFVWPSRMYQDVYTHKTEYQLETFFKRYRFAEDKFSDQQLVDLSLDSFLGTQERIARPLPLTEKSRRVLKRARLIATRILGKYSEAEHMAVCRFAKEACVGHPRKESYLDLKCRGPITGSPYHLDFLRRYLETDPLLNNILSNASWVPTYHLTLTFVPKSFKALRAIMPDTLAGSFYTSGLGRLIQERLKTQAHLDIQRLQGVHGKLVRAASKNCKLATADLSAASDSLTVELLRRILPREWSKAVLAGRIAQCKYNDSLYKLESTCTMGLGHTFPLQTLIFYAIIKSIAELAGLPHCKVSVYGDDLIYDTRIHRYVEQIFPDLLLILNKDKTYATREPFRESCGSDYYLGCDVRPACIEAEHNNLCGRSYVIFLYGLCNAILRRWHEEEVEKTITYLLDCIFLIEGEILCVPSDYPDGSGAKISDRFYSQNALAPQKFNANRTPVIKCLQVQPKTRAVTGELPFLWDSLRVKSQSKFEWEEIQLFETGIIIDKRSFKYCDNSPLRTRTVTRKRKDTIRRGYRKEKVVVAFVPRKDSNSISIVEKGNLPKWWGWRTPFLYKGLATQACCFPRKLE